MGAGERLSFVREVFGRSFPSSQQESHGNGGNGRGDLLSLQLWLVVLLLLGFGLVVVYSASAAYAMQRGGSGLSYAVRQGIYMLGCLTTMGVMAHIPTDKLMSRSRMLLIVTVLLLAGLLIPGVGVTYNQACRWYQLPGGVHFQPAEYAKVVWIIYLSNAIARRREKLSHFTEGLLFYTMLTAFIGGLILKEPDFGNAFLIGLVATVLLAAAGVPFRHFLALYLPSGIVVFYLFIYRVPYRWIRVKATYDPWTNPLKEGYHLLQAWTGIGSGGVSGQGLGMGIQKLFYIPEPFTDFILAVVGHELGLIGIVALITLFLLLFSILRKITIMAKELRKKLLALGITTLLMSQVVGNMAVVMGILPTKGLPLPFISYGGSNLIATGIAVGIMMRVLKEVKGT